MEKVFEKEKQFYFEFLDRLRESGYTNMYGATPYLMSAFPVLSVGEAYNVLGEWIRTFSERHPK